MSARGIYLLLSQDRQWRAGDGSWVAIEAMSTAYKRNVVRMVEKKAALLSVAYGIGQIDYIYGTTVPEVVGEVDGKAIEHPTRRVALFAPHGEMAQDAVESFIEEEDRRRIADPLAWVRTTPLMRRLLADIAVESEGTSAIQRIVRERAKEASRRG